MLLLLPLLIGLASEPIQDYRVTSIMTQGAPAAPERYASSRGLHYAGTGSIPAPDGKYLSSAADLVQFASGSADELRRENESLRRRLADLESERGAQRERDSASAAAREEPMVPEGMKSAPGWRAEMFPWNTSGEMGPDAKRTELTQSCRFNGFFGHAGGSEMSIYRFTGIYRAKQEGRHVFALETTCDYGHECRASFLVNGGEIFRHDGRIRQGRLVHGAPLAAGDHTLEFRIWMKKNIFVKSDFANRFQFQPLVKGPDDLTPRPFRQEELFSLVPAGTRQSVLGCRL